jgi:PAS domain-containing protein
MAGELNLFENNPLPAWICEPKTLHVIQVNKAAVRAFGYTRATWLKGALSDLITGKLNTQDNAPVAGTITHNDGRALSIQLCTSIVTIAEQKMILVTGYDFSVERPETEKFDKAANKAVEEEAKKLALVTSHISNGVILTDREGKITWVNAGFERITEYKPAEVIGKKPGSFCKAPRPIPQRCRICTIVFCGWKAFAPRS